MTNLNIKNLSVCSLMRWLSLGRLFLFCFLPVLFVLHPSIGYSEDELNQDLQQELMSDDQLPEVVPSESLNSKKPQLETSSASQAPELAEPAPSSVDSSQPTVTPGESYTKPVEQPTASSVPADSQQPTNESTVGKRKRMVKKRIYDEVTYKWIPYINLGFTMGSSSTFTLSTATSSSSGVSESGGSAVTFGAELNYRFMPYFQLAALLETAQYKYASATASNDTSLAFMIMPRGQWETFRAVFWGGVSIGTCSNVVRKCNHVRINI